MILARLSHELSAARRHVLPLDGLSWSDEINEVRTFFPSLLFYLLRAGLPDYAGTPSSRQ